MQVILIINIFLLRKSSNIPPTFLIQLVYCHACFVTVVKMIILQIKEALILDTVIDQF